MRPSGRAPTRSMARPVAGTPPISGATSRPWRRLPRTQGLGERDSLDAARCGAHDLDALVDSERQHQRLGEEGVIVDDKHPYDFVTATSVAV